jgi:hypothetical protein
MIIVAISQRKNARLTGPICLYTPLAIMKFPDQIRAASVAKRIPK